MLTTRGSDVNELNPRLPAVAVLAGVVVAAALLIASSLKYPAIVQFPGAAAVLALTVVALLGYAGCGAWALRHPSAGQRTGLTWARSVPRCGRRRSGRAARPS